jgi:hypothetical protein
MHSLVILERFDSELIEHAPINGHRNLNKYAEWSIG